MASVFLNGELVEREGARVSAFDAGLQHGVGVFETFLARGGAPEDVVAHRLDEHLARLAGSAAELGLSERVRVEALGEAVRRTVAASGLERARVRVTLTGGDLNMLEVAGRSQHTPTVMVVAQPVTAYPQEMFEQGVRATLADARANPLDPTAGHKTLNYWWRLRELQRAAAKGAGEALVFQVTNHLCGGCVSNALIVKDGRVVTPIARGEEADVGGRGALPSPVLPGVTRAEMLGECARLGLSVERRMVTIDDVLGADEVVLTNSSWGALAVVGVEREGIGNEKPGEVARSLRAYWMKLALS
ncbi:MAG: aminotransferase class IV [Phycisphaerales bacterium]